MFSDPCLKKSIFAYYFNTFVILDITCLVEPPMANTMLEFPRSPMLPTRRDPPPNNRRTSSSTRLPKPNIRTAWIVVESLETRSLFLRPMTPTSLLLLGQPTPTLRVRVRTPLELRSTIVFSFSLKEKG